MGRDFKKEEGGMRKWPSKNFFWNQHVELTLTVSVDVTQFFGPRP
jgi:hypothetical protein